MFLAFSIICWKKISFITKLAQIHSSFYIVYNLYLWFCVLTIRYFNSFKCLFLFRIFYTLFLFFLFHIISFFTLFASWCYFIYYQTILNFCYFLTNWYINRIFYSLWVTIFCINKLLKNIRISHIIIFIKQKIRLTFFTIISFI